MAEPPSPRTPHPVQTGGVHGTPSFVMQNSVAWFKTGVPKGFAVQRGTNGPMARGMSWPDTPGARKAWGGTVRSLVGPAYLVPPQLRARGTEGVSFR